MIEHAIRLTPGQDLKNEIEKFTNRSTIGAGVVLSGAGSLSQASLRMANADKSVTFPGPFEIVSLTGTLSPTGLHLHMSISDHTGKTIGGHVLAGCTIHTTAELVIGELESLRFRRTLDPATGYKELVVEQTAGQQTKPTPRS